MKRGQNSATAEGVRVGKTAGFNSEQEKNGGNGEWDNPLKFVQNLRELDEK